MSKSRATKAERQFVVFELNGQAFGVDISAVREVMRMSAVIRAEQADDPMVGAVTLRGSAVPVIDLRSRFGIVPIRRSGRSRVVVVDAGGQDTGMVVDAVTEACRVPESHLQPLSEEDDGSPYAKFVTGAFSREEGRVLLLDPAQLISPDEAGQADAA